jgi:hypothetical protein
LPPTQTKARGNPENDQERSLMVQLFGMMDKNFFLGTIALGNCQTRNIIYGVCKERRVGLKWSEIRYKSQMVFATDLIPSKQFSCTTGSISEPTDPFGFASFDVANLETWS